MIDIQRYAEVFDIDDTVIKVHPNGMYVLYADYVAVLKQLRNDLRAITADRDGFAKVAERRRRERDEFEAVANKLATLLAERDAWKQAIDTPNAPKDS